MNIVFIGASQFGLNCLSECLKIPGVTVAGIVTSRRVFSISYRPNGVTNVLHADLAKLGEANGVPIRILEHSMNEISLFETVVKWKPDAFLVCGWYHMIPKSWRELAPAYGLHASLLPDYSGGAPLVWAILNGEKKTGITMFEMDDGVDSGLIVGQKGEPINSDDTIKTLYGRIEERGLELIRETLPQLVCGSLRLQKQDEAKRRIFPQRSPGDGIIDWSLSAEVVERCIRAQTRPYPGAYTNFNGNLLHIWRAQVTKKGEHFLLPGFIDRSNDGDYRVACGSGAIVLHEISYDQKNYTGRDLNVIFAEGGIQLGI